MMVREKERRLGTRRRKNGIRTRRKRKRKRRRRRKWCVIYWKAQANNIFCHVSSGLFPSYKKSKDTCNTFLMCRILGSHISGYVEYYFLGYST
jgi:hypothetical protein